MKQLEILSNVSSSQINEVENNKKDITLTNLCRIAKALKVDEKELYDKVK